MSDGQISYGDYSETTAKLLAESVKDLPENSAIVENVGVQVGGAKKYRAAMTSVLKQLSSQVDELVSDIDKLSANAAGAISSIRDADAAAEEQYKQFFEQIIEAETVIHGQKPGSAEPGTTSNSDGK
ncbi:hypothetical protein [Mycetocola saprophilus]|uniref:hypothetical protein n=1 Tax=Mycetocola saprophilus TaxID=76636 RepID=UPI0012DCA850|nr:hypothetical protein [Mycetocola saprophilus]